MVLFGYPTASIFQKEDYAAMTLLGAVMAGYHYPGGWLHTELRGEGLVYAVHAMQVTGPVPGYFEILAQTRPDKLDEVVARIERNVERAKEGRISRRRVPHGRGAGDRPARPRKHHHRRTGQQAALDELYGLGYDYHKGFDARIEAVKLQDVVAAARKYFGNHVLVTSSPEKGKK